MIHKKRCYNYGYTQGFMTENGMDERVYDCQHDMIGCSLNSFYHHPCTI